MRNLFSEPIYTIAFLVFYLINTATKAQIPENIKSIFPEGTIMHNNIAYANDTLKKHLLDIYIPSGVKEKLPLVIWVHGGAWFLNDKFADMGYMKSTINALIKNGYALASIDYRRSTTAPFPAQIQDCNAALDFLYQHANEYNIDRERFALIGFSAGGHLASMVALTNNENIKNFSLNESPFSFKIKATIDFYGPSDLLVAGIQDDSLANSPIGILLGALPVDRPDLAKAASPVTYVDKNDPPFLIIHGEKDESVPVTQSQLLQSYLQLSNIKNELIVVKGAPHYGEMFDSEEIRNKILLFLKNSLR
ncbi:MAG TPA: alpha/beta hydrolase [Cytophagales bacterium]|nr:alpha/beta hydrolase [Cytophagales bacterium]